MKKGAEIEKLKIEKTLKKACTFENSPTITIGMGKKPFKVTAKEQALLQALRDNPKLQESFESLLSSSNATEGKLLSGDQVEEAVIKDVRGIGHAAMTRWAKEAEGRLATELKKGKPSSKSSKKKP